MQLILYSKPGCHLCAGLQLKLEQVRQIEFELEIRDITTREDWWTAYEYEVPVLCQKLLDKEKPLPRISPRAPVAKLEQMLRQNLTI
ncbi:glutaredoxin family protein [Pleurocapsa sp. CCALA 161]|uniref:glutaredoxin family protein n=1 Tax=Pleurocapsa sp. CCALA 161 TaxID=2107688 RepID=UPI000D04AF25|nr:glutaredoxin family protein [Pleurocapsa sp. CCALA 161]PSB09831.1 glutaredoxin family protein [Pleurocapsa sp. CCALA 161]